MPVPVRGFIGRADSEIYVSAASAWEIATKYRIGKLPIAASLVGKLAQILARQNFRELSVTLAHGELAGSLPGVHRDPFDRLIVAQALAEGLTLVSNESLLDGFGVARLW